MGVLSFISALMLHLTLIQNQCYEKKYTMYTGSPFSHLFLCL